jgi:hypothetical protein
MKRKNLISSAGEAGTLAFMGEGFEGGDNPGLSINLDRKGALSLFGIICLILCFLVGLAAIFLLLFSLI